MTFHPQAFQSPRPQFPALYGLPPSYRVYNIDDESTYDSTDPQQLYETSPIMPEYPMCNTNRRMIIPYSPTKRRRRQASSSELPDPVVFYRFFEFHCRTCDQTWLSPLFRAKAGCFCRICHHFVLPRGIRHSFTPYLGKETCYGKYTCQVCSRGWSSYKSQSNCPDQCFQCGTFVYPYYQIAHSVLFRKIHSTSDPTKSAVLKSIELARTTAGQATGNNNNNNNSSDDQHRSPTNYNNPRGVTIPTTRKMISISGILSQPPHHYQHNNQSPTAPLVLNKKRRNVPFLAHHYSSHIVRRQMQLKQCFSEPVFTSL